MLNTSFFLDVNTLFESRYTGISNVNFHLAEWFRRHHAQQTQFYYHENIVPASIFDEIIARKSGAGLKELWMRGGLGDHTLEESLQEAVHDVTVGISSNVKTWRNRFDYEAQIIYDLTCLITPEFHHPDTILHHGATIEEDANTSDLLVCISKHTLEDMVSYLEVPRSKMMVAYLGANPVDLSLKDDAVEPYVLVLGTVEPRKNIHLILEVLSAHPQFLKLWRFVFIGNDGWGTSFERMLQQAGLNKNGQDRILHLGYVTDAVRNALLVNASLLLYPSFYEGFGLPVLEALQAGCPVIAAYSSSVIEVGGDNVRYIDPYSTADLAIALEEFSSAGGTEHVGSAYAPDRLKARASLFSWDCFCSSVYDRIVADVEKLARS